MKTIKIRFICSECKKLKVENRFACADEKKNKEAEKKIFKEGFICCDCWQKKKMPFRYEMLIQNKRYSI